MGKQKHGEPDRFRTGELAIDERPATEDEALAAVKRFVEMFVLRARRERVQSGLLHPSQHRRIETIQSAYKWVDPALQSELEGNTGFPRSLHERFGDLKGVMIDDRGARHVTVAGAAILSSGQFASIFVADSIAMALLLPEVGAPSLCLT